MRQFTADPTEFAKRHIGPNEAERKAMLGDLGYDTLDELCRAAVPASILIDGLDGLPEPCTEVQALAELRAMAAKNEVYRSFIGMGYHGTLTPTVIQRNILENPGWYTQYTPYQAEIAQGRLEALLNFQTVIRDLTAMEVANSSLLDEPTAAAEAMAMCIAAHHGKRNRFFVADDCHPQTIGVLQTRADGLNVDLVVGPADQLDSADAGLAGVLVQFPTTDGRLPDYRALAASLKENGTVIVAAADPLALTLFSPPGEWGADIVIGSTQRLGVPMGYGGPHAAYMATHEKLVRRMPGRLVGISRDIHGNPALRLAIQTREQHIKRDRATSNICTAQVLLAVMASMYVVYHGPEGLTRIARRIRACTEALARALRGLGLNVADGTLFDTIRIRMDPSRAGKVRKLALDHRFNFRYFDNGDIGISLDEPTTPDELQAIFAIFARAAGSDNRSDLLRNSLNEPLPACPDALARSSSFLTHPVFKRYHTEHELLRYIHRLQSRDLSLTHAMIPLGSCTMKLNATSLMVPVSWPEFAALHPFAPREQAAGYADLFKNLESWLARITGFSAVSLQPNAGSQGEYAGLLAIRAYHRSRGQGHRDICLIPVSAHGTNPASAVVAGMKVVPVQCDSHGNIDLDDLKAKAGKHADNLAALMITYPSTHGVFEKAVADICRVVHEHGGQVYLDGANLNAMVGLCRPADFGADVCHFNLHKTFCIPHGGGGPGMGPIAMAAHLAPFRPGEPLAAWDAQTLRAGQVGPVSAATWGSAGILPISWMYIRMMGASGLRLATQTAILNANYLARKLGDDYSVLFTGNRGTVAHEFIIDLRHFHVSAAIEIDDVAKRLIDYGFHAPTMSWPVAGTLMIEPTESESLAELDRFVEAMLSIRREIRAIEEARADLKDNVLKHAPYTAQAVSDDAWTHGFTRRAAAYPVESLNEYKFWPPVGRIDNPYGDRNLVCACAPVAEMEDRDESL
ncbi:MAG: aminomethyl-transferring glycine dehydrogenase [Phycisphaeraceae bacterium]|nr:aminomethyl-transferring glycine dehydrogenase [Phycisphaeraceae bacterium]